MGVTRVLLGLKTLLSAMTLNPCAASCLSLIEDSARGMISLAWLRSGPNSVSVR
jgi:hypothetical protein